MVRIVTGKINSGKTTKLESIYRKTDQGDGFISKKIMIGTDVYGFKAKRLSDGYETMFMLHERYYAKDNLIEYQDDDSAYKYEIGPYKVLTKALDVIDETYTQLIEEEVSPLYFDEVGKLEVNDLGYAKYISLAISRNIDVYLVIREDLINMIVKKFDIKEYSILSR